VAALRRQPREAVALDQGRPARRAVTTAAMGLRLNQIREAFALLLDQGKGKVPGRATLGRWVRQHARKAAEVLAVLGRHTRPAAVGLCADEIFSRGTPALVGVEPRGMALLLCRRAEDRTGATRHGALAPFTGLEYVACDQGKGPLAGLKALGQDRHQAGGAPPGVGPDVFHTEREAQKVPARDWRQLQARWERAEAAGPARARAQDRRGKAARARAAWREARWWWSSYERREAARHQAKAALGLSRPDGPLNDRAGARGQIAQACRSLPGPAWRKVRALPWDGRALTFPGRLHRRLAVAEPRQPLREALGRLGRLGRGPRTGAGVAAAVVQRVLCAKLAGDGGAAYARVAAVLGSVVRASSAVECANRVLRVRQARHRGLGQEMLDLRRLYWNSRPFRAGKRRRKCPYQLPGVHLPTYDFWELPRSDPAQLEQELSTPRVAA
jgi:hypothetical protein